MPHIDLLPTDSSNKTILNLDIKDRILGVVPIGHIQLGSSMRLWYGCGS